MWRELCRRDADVLVAVYRHEVDGRGAIARSVERAVRVRLIRVVAGRRARARQRQTLRSSLTERIEQAGLNQGLHSHYRHCPACASDEPRVEAGARYPVGTLLEEHDRQGLPSSCRGGAEHAVIPVRSDERASVDGR